MTTREMVRMWTRDSLATHLESEVMPVALASGQALPSERSLSEQLGVSRALVREVLRALEQRGLVEILPGKGAYAREPGSTEMARAMRDNVLGSHATARHLLEARVAFEVSIADHAATRRTGADLQAMRRVLERFDAASGIADRACSAFAFHWLVARAAHNPVLSIMSASLSTLVFETVLRSLQAPAATERVRSLCGSLLTKLEEQDSGGAVEDVRALGRLAEAAYGNDLDRPSAQQVDEVLRRAYGPSVSLEDIVAKAIRDHALLAREEGALS